MVEDGSFIYLFIFHLNKFRIKVQMGLEDKHPPCL